VRYQVPGVSMVDLRVFDLLGREVAVLVNGVRNAGTYDVSFDASSLPSGVYFARITAGMFTATKRMVLTK
ncbi:MAG: T9SS type A sorting domain-containing protein, partial [Bacteroidetes bacterium]|nr:T9SS type A sorting domain-containing protein [Bacteroidota bacterium]